MENKKLLGASLATSLLGLSALFTLSLSTEPTTIFFPAEEQIGKYILVEGIVSEKYEKFLVVNDIEVFSLRDVVVGDFVVVEGVLEETPKKYRDRGFPAYQIFPDELKLYNLNESFFVGRVENDEVTINAGTFTFNRSLDFNGIAIIIGKIKDGDLVIDDMIPFKYDFIEGKVEKRKNEFYITDIKLDIPDGTIEFGDHLKAYGLLNKEFLCLHHENMGKSIDTISDLELDSVCTIQGTVISKRCYYDGYLIEIEDKAGKVKAYVRKKVYAEYMVEVSGVYKEYRKTRMIVGEAEVISDNISVYDLTEKIEKERFWGRGRVRKVENVRGHLYAYIGEYKISVYAEDAKDFLEEGIDLYHSEGKTVTIFLEKEKDEDGKELVLMDVKK